MCAYVTLLRMGGTLSKLCLKFLSFSERHLRHSYQLPKHHNYKIKSQEQNFIFPKRGEKLLQNFFPPPLSQKCTSFILQGYRRWISMRFERAPASGNFPLSFSIKTPKVINFYNIPNR